MKKIFTINLCFLIGLLSTGFLGACAFTEYGNRINQEQEELGKLENKRHDLEGRLIIILNSLELHPTEHQLMSERDKIQKRIQETESLINQKRTTFAMSLREWQEKITQERLEHEMIDKEVHDNEDKVEQP
jgi:hypothetical protein